MGKVSLIAAVFFAMTWHAVAEDGNAPKAVPSQYSTPRVAPGTVAPGPAATEDDPPKPAPTISPNYTPRPLPEPAGEQVIRITTPTVSQSPMWQIHRMDSDTLLLNAATGETWMLDRSNQKQYKWQPIARGASLPTYLPTPALPSGEISRPAHFL